MPNADLFLTDREFAVLLTITIAVLIIGGWLAIVRTLHAVNRACSVLLKRTELLEEHVIASFKRDQRRQYRDADTEGSL